MALSPDGTLLVSVDEHDHALIINFHKRVIITEIQFKKKVTALQFSPDGKFLAVGQKNHVHVWRTPPLITQYRPLILHRQYTGHSDDITCITWSPDSLFFITGSKDTTCMLYSLYSFPGFAPLSFTGHTSPIVGVYFGQAEKGFFANEVTSQPGSRVYSVAKSGAVYTWLWNERSIPEDFIPENELPNENKESNKENDDNSESTDSSSSSDSENEKEQLKRKKPIRHYTKFNRYNMTSLTYEERKAAWEKLPFIVRGTYKIHEKNYLQQDKFAKVNCVALYGTTAVHKVFGHEEQKVDDPNKAGGTNLLVIGLDNGTFSLYEMPTFQHIHSLSISQEKISTVSINSTGDWLAFGSAKLGQLLVWEWKSETYVLKQQSHFYDTNTLAFSPDGQLVATGGDDGKVKIWNASTGFCFVTFSDHIGPVNAVEFTQSGTVLISAGVDGSVRAYDLIRYRNFRTMVTPSPVQFTSLSIDPSGEIVTAGALDPFECYVWSLQTGKLLDVLTGHTSPISGLSYSTAQSLVASSSWDKSVRIWDIYSGKGQIDLLEHPSDVLALAYRPDGRELATTCLDGNIYIWDSINGNLKATINGRLDMLVGRNKHDARTASSKNSFGAFNSICYSSDGTCVLVGGNSRYVCIYELSQKILLRRFSISNNLSLDGMLRQLNSKNILKDGSNINDIDADNSDDEDYYERREKANYLPGAKTGPDFSSRTTLPSIRTKCVRFSPTGLHWAACSTEGIVFYSLDDTLTFDPTELDLDITPLNCLIALEEEHNYSKALVMALALNERYLVDRVIFTTPLESVRLVVRSLPIHRLQRVLEVLASLFETSRHIMFLLVWIQALLTIHGQIIRRSNSKLLASCRALLKTLSVKYKDLSKLTQDNQYMLGYLSTFTNHLDEEQLNERVEKKRQRRMKEEKEAERLMAVQVLPLTPYEQGEGSDDDIKNRDPNAPIEDLDSDDMDKIDRIGGFDDNVGFDDDDGDEDFEFAEIDHVF